jgi:hypothetical protein
MQNLLNGSSQPGAGTREHYLDRAIFMLNLAENEPDSSTRASYLELAATWHNLAMQVEGSLASMEPQTPASLAVS